MAGQPPDAPVDESLTTSSVLTLQRSAGSSENQSDASGAQETSQTSAPVRRKRGRPRKHPLPDGESKINVMESTRFIHVSQEGPDQGTRRAIRSHAMSAFRRDQREQRRVLHQASESSSETVATLAHPPNTATAARSSSISIAFERLPLTVDNATLELLAEHFGAQDSAQLSQRLQDQIQYFRKIDWLPMQSLDFVRSAQLAWVEIQSESTTQPAVGASGQHLLRAYAEINEAIQEIDQMPVESLCYSVALCISAACTTGDLDAFEAHFRGFSALLAHQDTWILNSDFLKIYLARFGLVHFYPGTMTVEKLKRVEAPAAILRQQPFVVLSLPALLQSYTISLASEISPTAQAETSFYTFYQQGLIPITLYESAMNVAGLQTLLERTSRGQITSSVAEDLVRQIWLGSCMLYNAQPTCLTALEKACRFSLMIHFYVQLFTGPPVLIDRLILSLLRQLRLLFLDLDQLLPQCSDLMIWLVFTTGTFAAGSTRIQISQILRYLQRRLAYSSYIGQLEESCRVFQWGGYIEEAAQQFGVDTASIEDDSQSDTLELLSTENFTEDDDGSDLMELCELELTVLGLVPAGL